MGVLGVASTQEAAALARRPLDPARPRPIVVISISVGQTEPWIDAERVAQEVDGLAEVWVTPTSDVSWGFARAMPARTEVYGGAGRAYPVDAEWQSDPSRAPLRLAFSAAEGPRATTRLIDDALGMAARAGLLDVPAALAREVEVEVMGFAAPARALVRTPDGGQATVWQELTYPDVPLERVLRRGMRVRGLLDPRERRVDLRPFLPTPIEVVQESYRAGDLAPVLVRGVSENAATLRLHPFVPVTVTVADVSGNPLDTLASLLTPGEVLLARVVALTDGRPRLSLLDVDDDEPAASALPLLPGGPPWLELPPPPVRAVPTLDVISPQPRLVVPAQAAPSAAERLFVPRTASPRPAPPTRAPALSASAELRVLRLERGALTQRLAETEQEFAEAQAELARLRTLYRETV